MTTNISDHQVRVYLYAKASSDWFTIQDLSTDTNVPDNSAKRHAERFEELGIFRRLRVSPNHLFRLAVAEEENARALVERLEEAAPVFEARRKTWLMREASAVGISSTSQAGAHLPHEQPGTQPTTSQPASLSPPRSSVHPAEPKVSVRKADKVDLLFSLISRPEGATLDELATTLGNQPHSVRATISVKSRERGISVHCESGRYFLASSP